MKCNHKMAGNPSRFNKLYNRLYTCFDNLKLFVSLSFTASFAKRLCTKK